MYSRLSQREKQLFPENCNYLRAVQDEIVTLFFKDRKSIEWIKSNYPNLSLSNILFCITELQVKFSLFSSKSHMNGRGNSVQL